MNQWITLTIVAVTYVGIALGEFPRLQANRTTIALMGVGLLLASGQVAFGEIGGFLNLDTLVLLFGMMILNANLQLSGFFRLVAYAVLRATRTPRSLLALEIFSVGLLSALFLNDTICIILTPLMLDLTAAARRNPIPYLIALATAANVGSVATLTGNPQNMIIGIASGISYLDFAAALTPIALLGMAIIWGVLVLAYREEFRPGESLAVVELPPPRVFQPLLVKSVLVTLGLLAAFILGVPIALASFVAACLLMLTRRVKPEKMFAGVDIELLFFFSGLFILTGVLESGGLAAMLFDPLRSWFGEGALALSALTAVLSNLVSNVPAVLLLKPLVSGMVSARAGWLTLAMSSTLAGNLTLLGSVANLIVAEVAARRRVRLEFWEYTRVGVVITLCTLAVGVVWIELFVW